MATTTLPPGDTEQVPAPVPAPVPAWQLTDGDLLRALTAADRAARIAHARYLTLVSELDTRALAADAGSPTTSAWLTANLLTRPGVARHHLRLARALPKHPATAQSVAAGEVSADHATVITDTLAQIPTRVPADVVAEAEHTLLQHAAEQHPTRLARIAGHLLAVLDPDGPAPDHTHPDAKDPTYFNLRTRTDGRCEGEFLLDATTALTLVPLIQAGSAPRPASTEGPDLRTATRRRADTLTDLVHAAATNPEPRPGAGRPSPSPSRWPNSSRACRCSDPTCRPSQPRSSGNSPATRT